MKSGKIIKILFLLFLSAGISYAKTSNQKQVENLLNKIYSDDPSSSFSIQIIDQLNISSSPFAALDQLSGEFILNSIKSAAFTNDFDNLYMRIHSNKSGIPFSIWVQYAVGEHYLFADGAGSEKFSADYSGGIGIQGGFNIIAAETSVFGIYANYNKPKFTQGDNKAEMSNIAVGLYGGFFGEALGFRWNLDAGQQDFDITRKISITNSSQWESQAKFQTYNIRGGLELELKIPISEQASIRPFIGAQGAFVPSPEIKEKTNSLTNLTIDEASYIRLLIPAGVKIGGESPDFNWNIKLYVSYLPLGNDFNYKVRFSQAENNGFMNISALEESKFSAGGSLGVELPLGERISILLSGGADIAIESPQDLVDYHISAGLNFKLGTKKEKPIDTPAADDIDNSSTSFMGDEKILLNTAPPDEQSPIEEQLRAEEARLGILHPTEKTTQEQIEENKQKLIEELKKRVEEARARRQKPLIRTFKMDLTEFETGSFVPTESAKAFIKQLAGWIAEYEFTLVTIEGHTDNVGNLQSNILLSSMRAKAVRDELYKNGIPLDKIYYIGYGPTMPIKSNATYNGKLKNRRVEIFVE
ncbi:MAG: autotransporter domain-containing protein [Endomicrobium sp.]|jgi:outer membrane protein OmpA-like peptidoglycan-associated protein|nr:autotransporter domain-containing protein [Endomicrobium sp.]